MLLAKLPPRPLLFICLARKFSAFVCRRSPPLHPLHQRPLSIFSQSPPSLIFRRQLVNSQTFHSRVAIKSIRTRSLTMFVQTTDQQQPEKEKEKEASWTENRGRGNKIVWPPAAVRGMTTLDVEAFKKRIDVPFVVTTTRQIGDIKKRLSPLFLKMPWFKPVVLVMVAGANLDHHKVYLHPDRMPEVKYAVKEVQSSLIALNSSSSSSAENDQPEQPLYIGYEDITLKYENFSHHDVFRAIFPETVEPISGFSTIGHLLHLNLRDEALPYKKIIGQVLLDKIHSCRMVINKVDSIDSTYRNFALEVLAVKKGETPTTVVTTTESELRFTFDFAKVYWNPRLSAERGRITDRLLAGVDRLYDVFAGVGPFALAAARHQKVRVLANDLNPASYESLVGNVRANKLTGLVSCSNLDGRAFIRTLVREDLLAVARAYTGADANRRYHVLMNLPDSAVNFLDAFDGLLAPTTAEEEEEEAPKYRIPFLNVHCYCFVKGVEKAEEAEEYVIKLAGEKLGHPLPLEDVEEVYDVRKVAPAKHMYRISFRLAQEILYNCEAGAKSGGGGGGGGSLAAQKETTTTTTTSSEDDPKNDEAAVKRPKLE